MAEQLPSDAENDWQRPPIRSVQSTRSEGPSHHVDAIESDSRTYRARQSASGVGSMSPSRTPVQDKRGEGTAD